MRGINRIGRVLVAAYLTAGFDVGAGRAALPPAETLLPSTTRLFVCFRNVQAIRDGVEKTRLGGITDDPQMKPLFDDIEARLDARFAQSATTAGLSLRDFKDLSEGQVTIAVVDLGNGQTGTAVMVDVTGHDQQLAAVRGKIATALAQKQAQAAPYASQAGAQGTRYDIPPQKEGGQPLVMIEAAEKVGNDVLWIVGDNPVLIDLLAGAAAGSVPAESLAKVEAFVKIMNQTKPAQGEPAAGLAVFVEPLNLAAALRAYETQPVQKPDPLEVFRNAGFDAIKGIGGQAVVGVGDLGAVVRVAAIAPKPHLKSMQMFSFLKGSDFAPQPWVRANVTAYATLYMDPVKAFENFDPIFDGFLEDEGIWQEVLRSLKEDEDGPQIDLKEEFFKLMGQRVTFLVDKKEPVTEDSAQALVAIELKPEAAERVRVTVSKAFANDETVEKIGIEGPAGPLEAWRVKIQEEVPPQAADQKGVVDGIRTVADVIVTVAAGHLLIASDVEMVQKVIAESKEPGLAHADDFVAVADRIGAFIQTLGNDPSVVALAFQRSDEMMKIDYELFRTGRLTEATTPLGRLANLFVRLEAEQGREVTTIDKSKLPPYDVVRKYLSPTGLVVNETSDGLFLTAFTLDKFPGSGKTPEPAK